MKNLFFNGFAKLALIGAMLCGTLAANADYKISVYPKNGGDSTDGTFSVVSGSEYSCTLTINNYTGNTADYKYWIGENGWQEGKSCNFELGYNNDGCARDCGDGSGSVGAGNYISSCSSGIITFYIYNDSGSKNYYPHNLSCTDTDCLPQAKGASIPAGTVIFYDNSNHLFDNEIWLSVPTESTNGNATSVNSGSYAPNKDNWYQMKKVEGDIWSTTISVASSFGRMSFWKYNKKDATEAWEDVVSFQAPYTSGKNMYKGDNSKDCYNSSRKTHVYVKGTWSTYSKVRLTGAPDYLNLDETLSDVSLYASFDGVSGTKYIWYSSTNGSTWNKLGETNTPEYTIAKANIPQQTTKYKVEYGGKQSDAWTLTISRNCGAEYKGETVFFMDFGQTPSGQTYKYRKDFDDAGDKVAGYTYQPWPKKINDGYYALVATPYWCGCGDGGNMSESVENCTPITPCASELSTDCSAWFRGYWYKPYSTSQKKMVYTRDHTLNNQTGTGPYGLMLMINYKDNTADKIAYKHKLTAAEKSKLVAGSNVRLSAWIASAAKEKSSDNYVKMGLAFQFSATGSDPWTDLFKTDETVYNTDDWKNIISDNFELSSVSGEYRIVIYNSDNSTGTGYDVLIDDIRLTVCQPTFTVNFYDESGTAYLNGVLPHINSQLPVKVQDKGFGTLGANPCLMLFEYDETQPADNGRYKFVSSLNKNTTTGFYETSVGYKKNEAPHAGVPFFTKIPDGPIKLVAVATTDANCSNKSQTISNIENGSIVPGVESGYIKSSNSINYSFACSDVETIVTLNGNKDVCEESGKKTDTSGKVNDLPKLDVTFGAVTTNVYYSLIEDNSQIGDDVALTPEQISAGTFTIDLNDYDGKIKRTAGSHSFSVVIYEKLSASATDKWCEKPSNAITLTVKPKPAYDIDAWPESIEYCTTKTISVKVTSPDPVTYQWYVNKNAAGVASNWEKIDGATAATYNLPADATDGWLYKVVLDNGYCTVTETTPVKLTKTSGVAPTVKPYEECATKESNKIELSTLVTSSYANLTWYKDDKTTKVTDATFDASVPTTEPIIYYVTDTPDGGCESELSLPVSVMVKKSAVAPTVKNYDECKDSSKPNLDLSTLIVNPSAGTQYKFYDETGAEIDKTVSISTSGVKTYSVGADAADGCGFEPVKITVTVKNTIESISLTPEEENIGLGGSVTKTLSYEPSDAAKTIDWTINETTFDGAFPRKPYTDEIYKVTITDECGNKFNASAKITVEWPTIFTPYNVDGANDDFVKGLESSISIQVYDRTGDMVYEGPDGWAGEGKNGTLVMPGVYYYVATLPDGSKRKATVEVYK